MKKKYGPTSIIPFLTVQGRAPWLKFRVKFENINQLLFQLFLHLLINFLIGGAPSISSAQVLNNLSFVSKERRMVECEGEEKKDGRSHFPCHSLDPEKIFCGSTFWFFPEKVSMAVDSLTFLDPTCTFIFIYVFIEVYTIEWI